MNGLDRNLLAKAARVFLTLAYPEGLETVPAVRRLDVRLAAGEALETLIGPPLGQELASPARTCVGYSFRLGSSSFPHVKLQVALREDSTCVFSVDTHDAIRVDPKHPDADQWGRLQAQNRQLKERIEAAWDAEGLMTFHGLLRRDLASQE